jgi:hypothetical protein
MKPSTYQKNLAVHMHFAEHKSALDGERIREHSLLWELRWILVVIAVVGLSVVAMNLMAGGML